MCGGISKTDQISTGSGTTSIQTTAAGAVSVPADARAALGKAAANLQIQTQNIQNKSRTIIQNGVSAPHSLDTENAEIEASVDMTLASDLSLSDKIALLDAAARLARKSEAGAATDYIEVKTRECLAAYLEKALQESGAPAFDAEAFLSGLDTVGGREFDAYVSPFENIADLLTERLKGSTHADIVDCLKGIIDSKRSDLQKLSILQKVDVGTVDGNALGIMLDTLRPMLMTEEKPFPRGFFSRLETERAGAELDRVMTEVRQRSQFAFDALAEIQKDFRKLTTPESADALQKKVARLLSEIGKTDITVRLVPADRDFIKESSLRIDDYLTVSKAFRALDKKYPTFQKQWEADQAFATLGRWEEAYGRIPELLTKIRSSLEAKREVWLSRHVEAEALFLDEMHAALQKGRPYPELHALVETRIESLRRSEACPADQKANFIAALEAFDQTALTAAFGDAIAKQQSASRRAPSLQALYDKLSNDNVGLPTDRRESLKNELLALSQKNRDEWLTHIDTLTNELENLEGTDTVYDKALIVPNAYREKLLDEDIGALEEKLSHYRENVWAKLEQEFAKEYALKHPGVSLSNEAKAGMKRLLDATDFHPDVRRQLLEGGISPSLLSRLESAVKSETKIGVLTGTAALSPEESEMNALDRSLRSLVLLNPDLDEGILELRKACVPRAEENVEQEERSFYARRDITVVLKDTLRFNGLLHEDHLFREEVITSERLRDIIAALGTDRTFQKLDFNLIAAYWLDQSAREPGLDFAAFRQRLPEKYQGMPNLERLVTNGLSSNRGLKDANATVSAFAKKNISGLSTNDELMAVMNRAVLGNDKWAADASLNYLLRHNIRKNPEKSVRHQAYSKEFNAHRAIEGQYESVSGTKVDLGHIQMSLAERLGHQNPFDRFVTWLNVQRSDLDSSALSATHREQIEIFARNNPQLMRDLTEINDEYNRFASLSYAINRDPTRRELLAVLEAARPGSNEVAAIKAGKEVRVYGRRVSMAVLALDRILSDLSAGKIDAPQAQRLAGGLRFESYVDLDQMKSSELHFLKGTPAFREKLESFLKAGEPDTVLAAAESLRDLLTEKAAAEKARAVLYFNDYEGRNRTEAFKSEFNRILKTKTLFHRADFAALGDSLYGAAKAARSAGEQAAGKADVLGGQHALALHNRSLAVGMDRQLRLMKEKIDLQERVFSTRLHTQIKQITDMALCETFLNRKDLPDLPALMRERDVHPLMTDWAFYTDTLQMSQKLGLSKEVAEPYVFYALKSLTSDTFAGILSETKADTRFQKDRLLRNLTWRSSEEKVEYRKACYRAMTADILDRLEDADNAMTLSNDSVFGVTIPLVLSTEVLGKMVGKKIGVGTESQVTSIMERLSGFSDIDLKRTIVDSAVNVVKDRFTDPNAKSQLRGDIARQRGLCLSKEADGYHLLLANEDTIEGNFHLNLFRKKVLANAQADVRNARIVELTFNNREDCSNFLNPFLAGREKEIDLSTASAIRNAVGMSGGLGGDLQLSLNLPDTAVSTIESAVKTARSKEVPDDESRAFLQKSGLTAGVGLEGLVGVENSRTDNIDEEKVHRKLRFNAYIGLSRNLAAPLESDRELLAPYTYAYDEVTTTQRRRNDRLVGATRVATAVPDDGDSLRAFLVSQKVSADCIVDVLKEAENMAFPMTVEIESRLPKSVVDRNPSRFADAFQLTDLRLIGTASFAAADAGLLKKGPVRKVQHFANEFSRVHAFDPTFKKTA